VPALDSKTIQDRFKTEFPESWWKTIREVTSGAEKIPGAAARILGYEKQPVWKKFMKDHPKITKATGFVVAIAVFRKMKNHN
jgi:hypothetical protein